MLQLKQLSCKDQVKYYFKTFYDSLTRHEIEYLMDNYPDLEGLNKHYKYEMISFLRYNTTEKISEHLYKPDLSEFSNAEIIKALDSGPLRSKTWTILYYLHRSGFRDSTFQEQYIPKINEERGYIEQDVYEYMITRLKVSEKSHKQFYAIWYKKDPSLVKDIRLKLSLSNARMLKQLGITNVILKDYFKFQNITYPEDEYVSETAKYLMVDYILNNSCPYDSLDWDDTPYSTRLDDEVMVQYFRKFKSENILSSKKYNICISRTQGVMDVIELIDPECIVDHYIKTGKLKEFIQPCSTSYWGLNSNPQELERLIEMKAHIKHVVIEDVSEQLIQTLVKENIQIHSIGFTLGAYSSMNYIKLFEYADNSILKIPDNLFSKKDMYKLPLYEKGTLKLWNLKPSLPLLRDIMKYAPTLYRKLIIPEFLKPFIDTSIKGFNHTFIGFYDITIKHVE